MATNHVKVKFMAAQTKAFRYQLQVMHEVNAHHYGEAMGKHLRSGLNRTLVGGNKGFKGAQPKFVIKVEKLTKGGVEVRVRIFMSYMGRNTPHYIWHIINSGRQPQGRAPRAFAKDVVRYPLYNGGARTTPRSLNVKPFSGYSGEWRTVGKGKAMTGIKAREFYRSLIPLLRQEHKKAKYRGWELKEVIVENG